MSVTTLNCDGLTFEEWVCAAGVAVIDQGFVTAYTSSGPDFRRTSKRRFWTRQNYPKAIRLAWKNGEDPSEWRAKGAEERKSNRPSSKRGAGSQRKRKELTMKI